MSDFSIKDRVLMEAQEKQLSNLQERIKNEVSASLEVDWSSYGRDLSARAFKHGDGAATSAVEAGTDALKKASNKHPLLREAIQNSIRKIVLTQREEAGAELEGETLRIFHPMQDTVSSSDLRSKIQTPLQKILDGFDANDRILMEAHEKQLRNYQDRLKAEVSAELAVDWASYGPRLGTQAFRHGDGSSSSALGAAIDTLTSYVRKNPLYKEAINTAIQKVVLTQREAAGTELEGQTLRVFHPMQDTVSSSDLRSQISKPLQQIIESF